MNEMLKEFIGKFVIVYLDDILIFSRTKGEHLQRSKAVREFTTKQTTDKLKEMHFPAEGAGLSGVCSCRK